MPQDLVYFNGLNCSRGSYLTAPLAVEELANVIAGKLVYPAEEDSETYNLLKYNLHLAGDTFGVAAGIDPNNLAESGWGIILPAQLPDEEQRARLDALAPLLDRRRDEAGEYYKELYYRPNESRSRFLARHGAGAGAADPETMPYYLLLVAGPEEIPFRFQHQLDIVYAVGRVHFDDPAAYRRYAESVVLAEEMQEKRPRKVGFFSVVNDDDDSTPQSDKLLVAPLLTYVAEKFPAWEIASTRGAAATKAELRKLVGGPEAPALLFTASHGAAFDAGDERQAADQGALLCADWPGPEQWKEPIPPEFYFSGADLAAYTPNLLGMINFHFACFGGGTPKLDRFRKWAWTPNYPEQIAPQAMVSGLPKALLSQQHGGGAGRRRTR